MTAPGNLVPTDTEKRQLAEGLGITVDAVAAMSRSELIAARARLAAARHPEAS